MTSNRRFVRRFWWSRYWGTATSTCKSHRWIERIETADIKIGFHNDNYIYIEQRSLDAAAAAAATVVDRAICDDKFEKVVCCGGKKWSKCEILSTGIAYRV
jgi:hypothetical protein